MPKFRVFGGNDAWLLKYTDLEADNAAQAANIANDNIHNLDWKQTGNVVVFDDFEVFFDMTEEIADDEESIEAELIGLSPRAIQTIRAALEHAIGSGLPLPMSPAEVTQLCKRFTR